MNIFICTIFFAIFLNESNGSPYKLFRTFIRPKQGPSPSENIVDDSKYDRDPITIACVSDENQQELHVVEIDGHNGKVPTALLERLDNDHGLSIFFHGAVNKITQKSGLMFWFAKEWFTTSGNNICIISYAYTTEPPVEGSSLSKTVSINRLDYVAQLGRDLIKGIQDTCWEQESGKCLNIHEVDVVGFAFGAHVAARTCEYIQMKTNGEKVRMLLALDPAKVRALSAKSQNTIFRELAHYVQAIHTSNVGNEQVGDVDIIVKSKSGITSEKGLEFFMFVATATKRLYVLAEKRGTGTLIRNGQSFPEPKSNECVVGLYGNPNRSHYGKKFEISLEKRNEQFREGLGMFQDEAILA